MNIYDVIVIGGGHAGCEAALAASRMGGRTLLLTSSIDTIAAMSCNPAIGGLAKGNLVKDIDALGGEMAKNIDATAIQVQLLNKSKGAAAQSTRAQADKREYSARMIDIVMGQANLSVKQSCVGELIVKNNEIQGVKTIWGEIYLCKKAILTAGTFLKGKIFIGQSCIAGGRMFENPSIELADSLKKLGFSAVRLKTGTPARIHADSIDYTKLKEYDNSADDEKFSFETEKICRPKIKCYTTYTNEHTHKIVADNIHKSLYYNSADKGVGPRYCPSMEDKIKRFSDKERHQIILEPEGFGSKEVYPNGFSTSLPADAQLLAYRTISGLENCKFIRPAYAIEYEGFQPTGLYPTFETKLVNGLYFAGQVNGTSGYEEAAAQGLMAGINAILSISGSEPFILGRDESYIGVLADDLVTKGIDEPYRMFNSRGEYRLSLREDNAQYRLLEHGYKFGLIGKARYDKFLTESNLVEKEIERLKTTAVRLNEENKKILSTYGIELNQGVNAYDFLKRPDCNIDMLKAMGLSEVNGNVAKRIDILIKYSGYIAKEKEGVEKFAKLEKRKIPDDMVYDGIPGMRREFIEKLNKIKPATLGQALRIPGMTPPALSILDIAIEKFKIMKYNKKL